MSKIRIPLVLFLWASTLTLALADQAADEATVRKNAEAYVATYNSKDAKALAAFWSPDAVYVNPQTGEEVVGREAITKQFTEILKDLGDAKLSVEVKSVVFVSPNVAVEKGTAKITKAKGEPTTSDYAAVSVKRDGKWLLDRVTEEDEPAVVSNYDKLKDLEWMIGSWVNQDQGTKVEMNCKWAQNQSFITRTFSISVGEQLDMSGIQVIGWDASKNKVRSWVFDSDGGFSEGTWTKKGKKWIVNSAGTLPDGRKTSAVNIMTVNDDNSITWQSTGRELDGEILPNIDPVKIVRSNNKLADSK